MNDGRQSKPKRRISVVLAVPCLALFVTALMPSTRTSDPGSWSASEWIEWRDRGISEVFQPRPDAKGRPILNREDVSIRSARLYKAVKPFLDPTSNRNTLSSDLSASLARFIAFLKAQSWMQVRNANDVPTHLLGLEVTDDEYWEIAFPNVRLPELLRSQPFLRAMKDPSGYRSAVNMIDDENKTLDLSKKWIVLPYKAQFIFSVDRTTYGRLLVFVPNVVQPDGARLDQWIQFAISTPEESSLRPNLSVSVVAVRRVPDGHATEASMVDYLRVTEPSTGQIQLIPTMKLPHNPSKNCYDCHKSAVLPIRPETEYEFDGSGKLVAKTRNAGDLPRDLNARIPAYGRARITVQDQGAYGPCLGDADKPRTNESVRTLIPEMSLSDDSVQRVKNSMTCSSCHNGFAPLNYLLAVRSNRDHEAFRTEKNMVQTYIEKGWMPPGNSLTTTERSALWKCLSREYFNPETGQGALIDWLKSK